MHDMEDIRRIKRIISGLYEQYGDILWWPGNSDEVIIGAILTQQTRWENVEKALENLRSLNLSSVGAIACSDAERIEDAIRCTGFYRVKTARLKGLAHFLLSAFGSVTAMSAVDDHELRKALLSVKGVGEETADSILCYGFDRCSFVIDAYTGRICRCAGVKAGRSDLKSLFEASMPCDNNIYRLAHAHIVEFAKDYCVKKRCGECWIRNLHE
jgi:endonuclease-3 related protein